MPVHRETIWIADTEPSERYPLYTRGNTGEVFPKVMSALTGTLIGDHAGRAQLEVFEELGFFTRRDRDGIRFGTGVFGGYLYGSGSLARIMGVRSPGMSATTTDEQVFGAVEDVPPYRRQPGDRNLVATARITRTLLRILRHPDLTPLDRARADAEEWLASMPDLATAADHELVAFVGTYPGRLAESMKRLLHFSLVAMGPRALLDQMIERAGRPGAVANRLVSGIDDIDSAQLAREQWELARLVAADPHLTALFDAGLDGLADRIPGTPLEQPLGQFLDRFGHRGNDEYELATPAWVMDPRPVLASLDRLRHVPAERSPEAAMERLVRDRRSAEQAIRTSMRGPMRALALRTASVSRAGSIGRERAKDILVLENLGARLALYELARRAAQRGGPTELRRAFAVTADELPRFVADPTAFADVIAERCALEDYLNEREPPRWFEGRIPPPESWPLRRPSVGGDHAHAAGAVLDGIAVSAGVASGPARVITDPADPRGLAPGDVLVCAITDPSWTPLFLVAAAVVCDTGAMQSHASIVARELGIPAVMSVPGITDVADGTRLLVDGDVGRVTIG